MKLLSIAIPCYNSQEYMEKCIESLLVGGENIEILIINDGSSDRTAEIADDYAAKYPKVVKAIHKENGGHGSAVNAGIVHATGLFYKVVDSDDWVQEIAYHLILEKLWELTAGNKTVDMFISNFVYEKEGEKRPKVMSYTHALPKDQVFTWKDIKHFHPGQYLLMHSVIFRTNLLKECALVLPEHTFYVDNLFVFEPLPYVQNMYYMDVNFYRYYIGRADQSVNEQVMIGRIDQQIRVNKRMMDYMAEKKEEIKNNKKLSGYMMNYLDILTTVSSIMLIRSGTPENLEKKKELWSYLKKKDRKLFHRMRYGFLGRYTNLPGKSGRKISIEGYKLCRRFFKFN